MQRKIFDVNPILHGFTSEVWLIWNMELLRSLSTGLRQINIQNIQSLVDLLYLLLFHQMSNSNLKAIKSLQLPEIRPAASAGADLQQTDRPVPHMGRNWEKQQLLLLLCFLQHHGEKLKQEKDRKASKIYKSLSTFIKTRNINQCRSYSNKLIKRFGSVESTVSFLRTALHEQQSEYPQIAHQVQDQGRCTSEKGSEQALVHRLAQNPEEVKDKQRTSLSLSGFSMFQIPEYWRDEVSSHGRQNKIGFEKDELIPTGIEYIQYEPLNQKTQPVTNVKEMQEFDRQSGRMKRRSVFDLQNFDGALECQQSSGKQQRVYFSRQNGQRKSLGAQEHQKYDQWRQCHELYLNWRSKLSRMIQQNGFPQNNYVYWHPGSHLTRI